MELMKVSPFVFNKAIAQMQYRDAEGVSFCDEPDAGDTVDVFDGDGRAIACLDYCDNPQDTWPLIQEMTDEGLNFGFNSSGVMTSNLGIRFGGSSIHIECEEGEELRAFAACWYQYQELKQEFLS